MEVTFNLNLCRSLRKNKVIFWSSWSESSSRKAFKSSIATFWRVSKCSFCWNLLLFNQLLVKKNGDSIQILLELFFFLVKTLKLFFFLAVWGHLFQKHMKINFLPHTLECWKIYFCNLRTFITWCVEEDKLSVCTKATPSCIQEKKSKLCFCV